MDAPPPGLRGAPRSSWLSHVEGPDGLRLALIDLDHPDFRVALDQPALERLAQLGAEWQLATLLLRGEG